MSSAVQSTTTSVAANENTAPASDPVSAAPATNLAGSLPVVTNAAGASSGAVFDVPSILAKIKQLEDENRHMRSTLETKEQQFSKLQEAKRLEMEVSPIQLSALF